MKEVFPLFVQLPFLLKLGAKGAMPPYFYKGGSYMLTFRFTGADGEMIQEDMLAAGMIGKQVRFEFSSDWDGLRKVAVYRAGSACCTSVDVGEVDTIPAEVLRESLQRLFVGIYGISEDGAVVTPAVFAPGPFIHISAVMGDDPCFDPENTFWIKLEAALEETVRFTPQSLTPEQQLQARENIGAAGGGGISDQAAKLLMEVLKQAVFLSDQSENLLALETALASGAEEDDTGSSDTGSGDSDDTGSSDTGDGETSEVSYSVSYALSNVTAENGVETVVSGSSLSVTLTAAEGYEMESVTVAMGGEDVTASVYADGVVTIAAVTGDVVITAAAVAEEEEETDSQILFVAASASASTIDAKDPPIRMCTVMLSGETPFLQQGWVYDGDVYPVPVPAEATALTVTAPGLIGGVQFYTLADGVYTNTLDTGWQTEDGFTYAIEAGAHDYCIVNFKNSDNSAFFTEDYDTSGVSIQFA